MVHWTPAEGAGKGYCEKLEFVCELVLCAKQHISPSWLRSLVPIPMAMAPFQQDLAALRIKTDRIEGELTRGQSPGRDLRGAEKVRGRRHVEEFGGRGKEEGFCRGRRCCAQEPETRVPLASDGVQPLTRQHASYDGTSAAVCGRTSVSRRSHR